MDGTVMEYTAGDVIFHEGDPPGDMFVIRSGRVVVSIADDGTSTTLATLEGGSFFGEMSVFDGKPRSATVTALDDVVLESVSRDHLASEMDSAVWGMLVKLSGRMRAVDESLGKHTVDDATRADALSSIAIRRNLYY